MHDARPGRLASRIKLKRGTRTLGVRRFHLRPGTRRLVKVRLGPNAWKLLRRRGTLRATAAAATTVPDAQRELTEASLSIHAPGRAPRATAVRRASRPTDFRLPEQPAPTRAELRRSGLLCVP